MTLLFFSCQKKVELNNQPEDTSSLKIAQEFLKSQLSQDNFAQLDWSHASFYKSADKIEMISIPKKNSPEKESAFVFFTKNKLSGNWVSIQKDNDINSPVTSKIICHSFNQTRVGIVALGLEGKI